MARLVGAIQGASAGAYDAIEHTISAAPA